MKYLAAFTCAIFNNQPMGFYWPAVLVKDAQRHGLRVKPMDVQISNWACTIEHERDGSLSLRLGLGYAKGLRKQAAEGIVHIATAEESFGQRRSGPRVPTLNRKELTLLARVGAMNISTESSIAGMPYGRWNALASWKAHCFGSGVNG